MRHGTALPALLCLLLPGAAAHAQAWNAGVEARGWTRMDKDGSCTFHDSAAHKLRTWMKDGGVISELDTRAIPGPVEKWALDVSGNAWIISGKSLLFLGRGGKVESTLKLSEEVEDVAWDAKGFLLCYRTPQALVEKRDYRTGKVIWTYKAPAVKGDRIPGPYRIAANEEGDVLVASNAALEITLVDGAKGGSLGTTPFLWKEQPAPPLFAGQVRGNIRWWLGKSTFLGALPGSRVPSTGLMGLLITRQDLSQGTVEFIPTGLTEDHVFAGINLDGEAVFLKPAGGLVSVPIP